MKWGNKVGLRDIFVAEALKNIAEDADIAGDSDDFLWVMDKYGKYFTFTKVETEEDRRRAYQFVSRLFLYLYPNLGGSRSDYMSCAIAVASRDTGVMLSLSEDGYPLIRRAVTRTALNPERAFKSLRSVGINIGEAWG